MKDQQKETIEAFIENITSSAASPAAPHLFDIDDKCPKLDEARSENFYHVAAKLLYSSKRARTDIETTVAFLYTRVSKCDKDNWKKLKRVLKYIRGIMDMPRIIGATSLAELLSWVDASYAVHWDINSHTGGIMSMGYGALCTKSSQQNIQSLLNSPGNLVQFGLLISILISISSYTIYTHFCVFQAVFH